VFARRFCPKRPSGLEPHLFRINYVTVKEAAEKSSLMSSRAKRGICFFANPKKKQIPRANRDLGMTLLEFFRNLRSRARQRLGKQFAGLA
jgi:hypothetical protein